MMVEKRPARDASWLDPLLLAWGNGIDERIRAKRDLANDVRVREEWKLVTTKPRGSLNECDPVGNLCLSSSLKNGPPPDQDALDENEASFDHRWRLSVPSVPAICDLAALVTDLAVERAITIC